MSDAPRWPGADGSSGLNFGPRGGADASLEAEGVAGRQPLATGADLARSQASAADWATVPVVADEGATTDLADPVVSPVPAPAVDTTSTSVTPSMETAKAAVRDTAATVKSGVASAAGAVVNAFRPRAGSASPVVGASVRDGAESTEFVPSSAARSATSASGPARASSASRRTRKARLRLSRIDPWSVMKTTFLFAFAFGIMSIVAVWVVWSVLNGTGALDAINEAMTSLTAGENAAEFRVEDYINGKRVMGAAAALSGINVILITAIATLFAFLYNLASTIMGGLEVTLAED